MFFWNRRRTSLHDEIAEHIALEIEENIEAGMPPEEARIAAQKKFGNVPLVLDRSSEAWGLLWLEYLLQDLRYALRTLKKSPGYTLTVVLTLALGLGATATILAVVDSVLLQPVGFPHPEQLVVMSGVNHQHGVRFTLSYPQIEALEKKAHLFQSVAGYYTELHPVSGPDEMMRPSMTVAVTPGFFDMLGVHALRGRLLRGSDVQRPFVVVTNSFWRERLHGKPHVVGTSIRMSNKLQTIIGVLPPGFDFPQGISAPAVYSLINLNQKSSGILSFTASGMARLKPGVSRAQALAEANSILKRVPADNDINSGTLTIVPYGQFVTGNLQKPLLVLLVGVGILLLIACANAANLQMAHAMRRMVEMHMRSALGASLGRLFQQLVVESLVLSLFGALLGGALAWGATGMIRTAYQKRYAHFDQVAMHPDVFLILALLAIAVGILASLIPLVRVRRHAVIGSVTPRVTVRISAAHLLVLLQVALTCVLLVVTGLFVRTFQALQGVKLGFDPHHVTALVLMPQSSHIPPANLAEKDTQVLARLSALPGVQSAALESSVPFSSYSMWMTSPTPIAGFPSTADNNALYVLTSSGFLPTSRIAVLRGRGFTPSDDSSPDKVALVNETFVHNYLHGKDPVGMVFDAPKDAAGKSHGGFTIVGEVQNEMQGGNLAAKLQPIVYLDYRQLHQDAGFLSTFALVDEFVIRSNLPQAVLDKEVRAALKQAAPDEVEMELHPMEQDIAASLGQQRLALRLVSSFGVIALLLSAIGIYGMLAYAVTARRREIGIRMALGSSRARVSRMILAQASRMVLFGIVPGAAGAWIAGHAIRSFLYGVKPLDPLTYAAVAIVLLAIALLAAAIPTHRAARVEPMEVLRVE